MASRGAKNCRPPRFSKKERERESVSPGCARPMGAALADAIADGQSRASFGGVVRSVCCGEACVVWPAGSCVEFFTYLLVVIRSFTHDGSEYVPRRTT